MDAKDLRRALVRAFPTLPPRRPWFGHDPVTLRDGVYGDIPVEVYKGMDRAVWRHIEALGLVYGAEWPDCDDYADIKLGRFKEEWWLHCQSVGLNLGPPAYGVCDGYNPDGEMHDFNVFVSQGQVYVSDYGQIVEPYGYRPIYIRF